MSVMGLNFPCYSLSHRLLSPLSQLFDNWWSAGRYCSEKCNWHYIVHVHLYVLHVAKLMLYSYRNFPLFLATKHSMLNITTVFFYFSHKGQLRSIFFKLCT